MNESSVKGFDIEPSRWVKRKTLVLLGGTRDKRVRFSWVLHVSLTKLINDSRDGICWERPCFSKAFRVVKGKLRRTDETKRSQGSHSN